MKSIKEFILKYILNYKISKEDFLNATLAYQKTTYSEIYSREQLRDKLISELKSSIKENIKLHNYLVIETFSGYREKQVLREVADYFLDKNYNVILHNEDNFSDVNVLIVSWQNLETFK